MFRHIFDVVFLGTAVTAIATASFMLVGYPIEHLVRVSLYSFMTATLAKIMYK